MGLAGMDRLFDSAWLRWGAAVREAVGPQVSDTAYGAGVEEETDTPSVAYAPFPKWEDGRPASWDGFPWNRWASGSSSS